MFGRCLHVDVSGQISNFGSNKQRTRVLEEKQLIQSWQVSALALDEMQRSSYHLNTNNHKMTN